MSLMTEIPEEQEGGYRLEQVGIRMVRERTLYSDMLSTRVWGAESPTSCRVELSLKRVSESQGETCFTYPEFCNEASYYTGVDDFFDLVTPFEEKFFCLLVKSSTSYVMRTEKLQVAGKIAPYFMPA